MHSPSLLQGRPRWRKVARDLLAYRGRTVAVVAAIAVGVFAVGTIAGASALLEAGLDRASVDGNAANATLYTSTGFDPQLVDAVRGMRGVDDAEGRRSVVAWYEGARRSDSAAVSAGGREIQLIAPDPDRPREIDRVLPVAGKTEPGPGEVVLERSALRLLDVAIGDDLLVRTADGKLRPLRVAGFSYEPGASPAYYFGRLNAYVSMDTLERLGWPPTFNELRIRSDDSIADRPAMQQLADDARQRIERAGTSVTFAVVPEPGRHPAQELVSSMFLVLGAIGFLSLFVAGFLIISTISMLMAQHLRQIGIMKVLGARERQVTVLYLALVAAYGAIALLIAVPLAALASLGLASLAAGLLNVDLATRIVPPSVIALEVTAGLAVPILASLVPIRRGVAITAHEAITSTGMDEHFGRGIVDRLVVQIRGLSRPMLLSIRSTFRRKLRLGLTLAALTLGGAVFMTIFTVRGSLFATLADTVRYFDYDVQVQLAAPARSGTLTRAALRVPGTIGAEPWQFGSALRVRPDGTESPNLVMFGLPPETQSVEPVVMEGRWLLPGEGRALVATANIRRDEPDLKVGDTVTLRVAGEDADWTLVGIVQSPTFAPFLYVDSGTLAGVLGNGDRAGMLMVRTGERDAAAQALAAKGLRTALEDAGVGVASTTTTTDVMTTVYTVFDTLVIVVTVMAVLLGIVGGLGLAGTMMMSVMERSREIGIMRAIGASDGAVRRIFVSEGIMIGLMAWLAGVLLSLPLSKVLGDLLGDAFVQRPLAFSPSAAGMALWLVVVLLLAILGSLVPAWRASRVVVREVLGYE